MRKFTFLTPNSLSEALLLLREHVGRIKPFAGGGMSRRYGGGWGGSNEKLESMDYALDLTALPELREITLENGLVSIGAMATHNDVAASPVVRSAAAMLAEASASVGAQQIRNTGTIGGNVCNAAVAADTLSPLAALDARVTLLSVSGARELPLSAFILGAGKTALQPEELLTKITFSPLSGWQSRVVKLGRRKALAISRMNASVALRFEHGVIAEARVSPGCVFASPRRVSSAEALLIGQVPSVSLFEACGKAVSEEMVAITGVRWSRNTNSPRFRHCAPRALRCSGTDGGGSMSKLNFTLNGKPVETDVAGQRAAAGRPCAIRWERYRHKGRLRRLANAAPATVLWTDAVDSCLYPALRANGKSVTTIEGLSQDGGSTAFSKRCWITTRCNAASARRGSS